MNKKLPIWGTVGEAFVMLWQRLPKLLLAWAAPVVVAIVLGFFSGRYSGQTIPLSLVLLGAISPMVALVWAFVSVTQVALHNRVPARGLPYWTMRETWLIIRSFLLYLICLVPILLTVLLIIAINLIMPGIFGLMPQIIIGVMGFLAIYFVAVRLLLLMTATASGDTTSFGQVWEMTRNHAMSLLILLALMGVISWFVFSPLVFLALNATGSVEGMSIQEAYQQSVFFKFFPFVGGIIMIPVLTFNFIVLALAYRHLKQ